MLPSIAGARVSKQRLDKAPACIFDPGQGQKRRHLARKLSAVRLLNRAGASQACARHDDCSRSRPQREKLAGVRRSECADRRKAPNDLFVKRNGHRNSGLLQLDFRNPHSIRIGALSPGIVDPVFAIPGDRFFAICCMSPNQEDRSLTENRWVPTSRSCCCMRYGSRASRKSSTSNAGFSQHPGHGCSL